MTILQGTMQDGSVIPIQVDAQGRLVAEGLQGVPGPAGPQGVQGEKGDPGAGGGMPDAPTLLTLPLPALSDDQMLVWRRDRYYRLRLGDLVDGLKLSYISAPIATAQIEPGVKYSDSITYNAAPLNTPAANAFDGSEDTATSTPNLNGVLSIGAPALTGISWDRIDLKTNYCRIYSPVQAHGVGAGWWNLGSHGPGRTWQGLNLASMPYGHDGVISLYGMKLDGQLLKDSEPALTLMLENTEHLDQFFLGDFVTGIDADGHATPATGTISTLDRSTGRVQLLLPSGSWVPGLRMRKLTALALVS